MHHSLQNDKVVYKSLGKLQMHHLKYFITFWFYRLSCFLLLLFLFFLFCWEKCVIPRLVLLKTAYIMWLELELGTNSVAQDVRTMFWEMHPCQDMLFAEVNLAKPSPQKTHVSLFQQWSCQANEWVAKGFRLKVVMYCSLLFYGFEWCF